MQAHLSPLSKDPILIKGLADDLEAARDMDCFERKCDCERSSIGHKIRAERGRALIEAKKAK